MNPYDPARAANKTTRDIYRTGAVFNINEGIAIEEGENCVTRLVGWPGNGTANLSFHTLTHRPGGAYDTHAHPMSEESIICLFGEGEIDLGNGWAPLHAGDAVFVPMGHPHRTRCRPGAGESFVALSYNCVAPMEYYQKHGFLKNGDLDYDRIDRLTLLSTPDSLPAAFPLVPDDAPGGHECGEKKGREAVAETGGVFNLFRGARYTGKGAFMRFILWPGIGAKMMGQHHAFHDPGQAFAPHVHPVSEDAVLALRGRGQFYLDTRWVDVELGDILYAPAKVRHGTACREGEEQFLSSGCACPPQYDLYENAGYLTDGAFGDFIFE